MNSNWSKTFGSDNFTKYQYGDGPYRVVVQLNDRGHYEALFTSAYGPPNYLIRGSCGGGPSGRATALAAAHGFMGDNPYGCPPPSEMVA